MLAMVDSTDAATDEAMRASEHFGPRLDVDETADAQARVLAFYGRRAIKRRV